MITVIAIIVVIQNKSNANTTPLPHWHSLTRLLTTAPSLFLLFSGAWSGYRDPYPTFAGEGERVPTQPGRVLSGWPFLGASFLRDPFTQKGKGLLPDCSYRSWDSSGNRKHNNNECFNSSFRNYFPKLTHSLKAHVFPWQLTIIQIR